MLPIRVVTRARYKGGHGSHLGRDISAANAQKYTDPTPHAMVQEFYILLGDSFFCGCVCCCQGHAVGSQAADKP